MRKRQTNALPTNDSSRQRSTVNSLMTLILASVIQMKETLLPRRFGDCYWT